MLNFCCALCWTKLCSASIVRVLVNYGQLLCGLQAFNKQSAALQMLAKLQQQQLLEALPAQSVSDVTSLGTRNTCQFELDDHEKQYCDLISSSIVAAGN